MNASSNSRPLRSLSAQLGRLHIHISRTSIRHTSSKRKDKETKPIGFQPGHGEKIWVFTNFMTGQTVYSHSPVLKATKALRQLPFMGKKLKPSKLRKDFWRPLAMVQFPEGRGELGRSVYHLMRELRSKHNLAWEDFMLRDPESNRTLTRHERGERIDREQKPNAVADLAVVLGGQGKGNRMVASPEESADLVELTTGLIKATVFWTDELDKNYAKEWPANVSHSTFAEAVAVPVEAEVETVLESNEDEKPRVVPAVLVEEMSAQQSGQQQSKPLDG